MSEAPQTPRIAWSRRPRREGGEIGHATPRGGRAADAFASPAPTDRRRQGGHPEDHALYTCGCGLQFDALVTTSVDCPHCGSTQAW